MDLLNERTKLKPKKEKKKIEWYSEPRYEKFVIIK